MGALTKEGMEVGWGDEGGKRRGVGRVSCGWNVKRRKNKNTRKKKKFLLSYKQLLSKVFPKLKETSCDFLLLVLEASCILIFHHALAL